MTKYSTIGARASLLALLVTTLACSDESGQEGPSSPRQTGGSVGVGGTPEGGGDSGGATSSGGSSTGGQSGGTSSGGSSPAAGGTAQNSGGTPSVDTCGADAENAYQGMLALVPGTVEAEDFDPEGYQDNTPGNEGGAYRPEVDVDIKEMDGGYAVGWMLAGEWLQYTVDVEQAGSYTMVLRAAAVEPERILEISTCGEALAEVDVPILSDWGSVEEVEATVQLEAGLQVLRIAVKSGDGVDLDSITFTGEGQGSGGAPGSGGASNTGGSDGTGGEPGEIPRFVGNITTFNQIDTEGLVFSDYWDQITPENAGKWGSVQGNIAAAPNWSTVDALYDYAQQKGIVFKQHAFIWGTQQPSGSISEADVREWMSSFCERYPNTRIIDVVNEPPPHTTPSYTDAIGGGTNGNWQWITNAFIWARESCPNAILLLNDYNNIEWPMDNQHFINIVNTVLQNGGPIDAIGVQAHDLDNNAVSFQTVDQLLTKMHNDTGLPIYVTELDLSTTDDQRQLELYEQYFPYFWGKDYIPGITLWGWIYGRTWSQAPNSGLVRDGVARPAMQYLMNELGRPIP